MLEAVIPCLVSRSHLRPPRPPFQSMQDTLLILLVLHPPVGYCRLNSMIGLTSMLPVRADGILEAT
jgi:hypothetical protein